MEPVISPPSSPAPVAPPARRPWGRPLCRIGLTVILLGTLLWAGWYVYNRGFTRKWRDQLTAELRRQGFDFTAKRLTLNPFEGLVAQDADLYLLDGPHTHLLSVSRVSVDISLANFIQHKSFLNSLDLRGARMNLPIDLADPGGPNLKANHLQAKLSFLPGEVRVTQAEGEFYGVQVSASGTLLHPESFRPGTAVVEAETQARRRAWAHYVTSEIEKVRSDRRPPRLDILFEGDLARLESLRASVALSGEALRRGSYRLENLRVRLDYAAGSFHLRQGDFTDAHGTLSASGDYTPGTGEARFQVQSGLDARQSGLDLVALANEFYPPAVLDDFRFCDPPRLQVDGRWRVAPSSGPGQGGDNPPPSLQCTGRVALGRFSYRKFDFDRAESDFSWNGDRWYLRDFRLVRPGAANGHSPGATVQQVTGDVLAAPAGCRVRLTSTFDPLTFIGLAPPAVRAGAERLEFREPPRVELNATGRSFDEPLGWKMDGRVVLGRTRYRGQGLNRLRGDFTYADHLLTGKKLVLERDEGNATGETITYDLDKHEVRLFDVRTNLDPATAGVWLDPDVYRAILPYKFRRPPTLAIHGNVQFAGGRSSHLVTEVSAPGGMDLVFAKKTLPFGNVGGQVVFNEERLQLDHLRADLFNGQIQGALDLALNRAKDYRAAVDLKNVDFVKLTKLYFDYEQSRGELSGNYHWTGRGDDPDSLQGAGTLTVERGNVFAIPFLGPLSSLLNSAIPGLGFDQAHQASATFLTGEGKVYTGNLNVKGLGFSLFGAGWLGYTSDTMNFRLRLNSRGLPGAVLAPVSWLLEYTSQGPLEKPVWRPRVLTSPKPGLERKPLTVPPAPSPIGTSGRGH